jgi:hypothetical protein
VSSLSVSIQSPLERRYSYLQLTIIGLACGQRLKQETGGKQNSDGHIFDMPGPEAHHLIAEGSDGGEKGNPLQEAEPQWRSPQEGKDNSS